MTNGTLPAYPVSGETVLTEWGRDLIDTIGERVYFVPNPVARWSLDGEAQDGSVKYHELTDLPANDPDVVAAECSILIRDSNVAGNLRHYSPTVGDALVGVYRYNTGTPARGGTSGSGFIRVGGVNNRQIRYTASSGADMWIRCHGWWKRAPKAPYPIEGDPIVAGWGQKVQEQLAPAWGFTPLFERILNDVSPAAANTKYTATMTLLPDDPDIVAVSMIGMIRDDSGGDNINMTLHEFPDDRQSASIYSSGVANRGGCSGPFIVMLPQGGKQMKWSASATGCSAWLYVVGYWRKTTGAGSLILPTPPAPGAPISSAWARDIIDSTAKRMGRMTFSMFDLGAVVNGVDGQTTIQEFEVSALPDPPPTYLLLDGMIRDTNGTESLSMDLLHPDDTTAGIIYTDGVQARGGGGGPYMVKLGGPNKKSFRWKSSQAGAGVDVWVYVHGAMWQEGEA